MIVLSTIGIGCTTISTVCLYLIALQQFAPSMHLNNFTKFWRKYHFTSTSVEALYGL